MLISPDFLALEATLEQMYKERLVDVPRRSFINSDAVNVGALSTTEALAMDLKYNLGLAAKYILGVNLLPFQLVILEMLWTKRFPLMVMTRGGGKTFILAVYAALLCVLKQGTKVVLVGANFRQSQLIFEYIEHIYNNAPLFNQCCKLSKQPAKWVATIGNSTITAVPLGHDGSTIRGLRATCVIADEFASINPEIFQVVVRGFAAVAKDPAKSVTERWKQKHLKNKGILLEEADLSGNQIILSGTAYYTFNHFYKTMERYDEIIKNKIQTEVEGAGGLIDRLDYHDYGIVQLPYTALPAGFMDVTQVGQAKATMHPLLFGMEYMAEFAGTTGGFFPMLDIENATAGNALKDETGNMILNNGEYSTNPYHNIELEAQADGVYVMGADPARETDNFAVCVIKITKDGIYRIVYADAWNRKEWGYSVRRLRELIKRFNIQRISIDKGGGGTTIEDLLKDTKYIDAGELPIFNIENEEEEGMWYQGLQILEVQDFTEYTWYRAANYSLQGDIHHRRILFPASYVDEAVYEKFKFNESAINDCYSNIQNMRLELAQIVRTVKGSNREHFDLPEDQIKNASEKGIIPRKDRYSALLLAAHAARTFHGFGEWKEKQAFVPGFWLPD